MNLPSNFDQIGARLDNAALLHAAGVTVAFSGQATHNARKQRQAEHGGFIGWPASIGAVVNRVFAMSNSFYGEYRKTIDFIVVTSVVAVRAFIGKFIWVDMTFQNNLCGCWYL